MILQFIGMLALLSVSAVLGDVDAETWNTVEMLCGRLTKVDHPSSSNERAKPIKKTNLRLYLRSSDASCCGAKSLVAEAMSANDGSFSFKNVSPGSYWIVVQVDRTDYKLGINYRPDSPKGDTCADLCFRIKSGGLELLRVVHVD